MCKGLRARDSRPSGVLPVAHRGHGNRLRSVAESPVGIVAGMQQCYQGAPSPPKEAALNEMADAGDCSRNGFGGEAGLLLSLLSARAHATLPATCAWTMLNETSRQTSSKQARPHNTHLSALLSPRCLRCPASQTRTRKVISNVCRCLRTARGRCQERTGDRCTGATGSTPHRQGAHLETSRNNM